MVVSHSQDKAAAMAALSTTLGLEDLYDLIEIILIDRHNDRILAKLNKDK